PLNDRRSFSNISTPLNPAAAMASNFSFRTPLRHTVAMAVCMRGLRKALLLLTGYQGYNAVFPSFYPELFPTRVRVSAMAISQNTGTTITALLPALFAAVAPPGSDNVPLIVGALAFGIACTAAIAALSARETYRVRIEDLGKRDSNPVELGEYRRMREEAMTQARLASKPRKANAI